MFVCYVKWLREKGKVGERSPRWNFETVTSRPKLMVAMKMPRRKRNSQSSPTLRIWARRARPSAGRRQSRRCPPRRIIPPPPAPLPDPVGSSLHSPSVCFAPNRGERQTGSCLSLFAPSAQATTLLHPQVLLTFQSSQQPPRALLPGGLWVIEDLAKGGLQKLALHQGLLGTALGPQLCGGSVLGAWLPATPQPHGASKLPWLLVALAYISPASRPAGPRGRGVAAGLGLLV